MVICGHALNDPALVVPFAISNYLHGMARFGVEVFFSLSGFLITLLLLREWESHGKVKLGNFYMRRALRIWPVYYLALAGGYLYVLASSAHPRLAQIYSFVPDRQTWSVGLPASALFAQNWVHAHQPFPLEVLWSICVEEQFYLLFPLLLIIGIRKGRLPYLFLSGLLVTSVVRGAMVRVGYDASLIYSNTFAHGDQLLSGAMLAWILFTYPAAVRRFFNFGGNVGQCSILVLCACLPSFYEPASPPAWRAAIMGAWPAFITTLLVGSVGLSSACASRVLAMSPWRKLGALTYSAYVFHVYVIALAWKLTAHAGAATWTARVLLSIAGTFLLASMSYRLLELPFLRLKHRFDTDGPAASLSGTVARD